MNTEQTNENIFTYNQKLLYQDQVSQNHLFNQKIKLQSIIKTIIQFLKFNSFNYSFDLSKYENWICSLCKDSDIRNITFFLKLIEALFVTCSEVKSVSGIEYTNCPSQHFFLWSVIVVVVSHISQLLLMLLFLVGVFALVDALSSHDLQLPKITF